MIHSSIHPMWVIDVVNEPVNMQSVDDVIVGSKATAAVSKDKSWRYCSSSVPGAERAGSTVESRQCRGGGWAAAGSSTAAAPPCT